MKLLAVDSGTGASCEILEYLFDDDELLLWYGWPTKGV